MTERMTCLEARRELQADPARPSAALRAHLADCESCAAAARRARALDERLAEALRVPVPDGLADRLLLAQTTRARHRFQRSAFALAATVVLSLTAALAWQFGVRPVNEARALETYVVEHIRSEPQAFEAAEPVPREAVVSLLAEYGLELAGTVDDITFLARCPTPSGTGLHFVVRTDRGPVTAIYMPGQRVDGRIAVNDVGLSGYVMPFRSGALALVGVPGMQLDGVTRQVTEAIKPS